MGINNHSFRMIKIKKLKAKIRNHRKVNIVTRKLGSKRVAILAVIRT